jgi:hypothetical protein
LLFWQTRTGPAAQMLAIPGAVALVWLLAPRAFRSNNTLIRVVGTTVIVIGGLGAAVPLVLDNVPKKALDRPRRADRQCQQQLPIPVGDEAGGAATRRVPSSPSATSRRGLSPSPIIVLSSAPITEMESRSST